MRIGVLYKPEGWNVAYRAQAPAEALRGRGHDVVVVVPADDNSFDPAPLLTCDVVHVYRLAHESIRRFVADLQKRGIAVTWDNDDDVRLIPAERQRQLKLDPYKVEREWQLHAKMIRQVDLVTTTTDYLADAFAETGASRVVRIENHLFAAQYRRPARGGQHVVIGWVAGAEHQTDDQGLGVSATLRDVLTRHPSARVVSVGLPLTLDSERYEHHLSIPLRRLNDEVRTWDIAIAPLAESRMSHARSNVKVKEYAAAGVPWLASARGPYAGLGAAQGGEVVADDDWRQALDELIGSRFKRFRLSRKAAAWAKTESIDRHVAEWEAAFEHAVEAARERALSRRARADRAAG